MQQHPIYERYHSIDNWTRLLLEKANQTKKAYFRMNIATAHNNNKKILFFLHSFWWL